jgi:hypothetical protein
MPHKDPAARRAWQVAHREQTNANRRAVYSEHRSASLKRNRAWRLGNSYGITVAEFDAALARQGGCCALCREAQGKRKLCVDHDHATGRFRGLLCIQCNSALGKLGDSVAGLQRAIAYLNASPDLTAILDSL